MLRKTKLLALLALVVAISTAGLTSCFEKADNLGNAIQNSNGNNATDNAEDEACDHDFGDWEYDEDAPTCSPRTQTRTCEDCDLVEEAVLEAEPHTFGEWVINSNTPTCSIQLQRHTCTQCNFSETTFADPQGHQLTDGKVETVDTGDNIVARFRCDLCNVLLQEILLPTDDFDGDKLTNGDEIAIGTDVFLTDSDDDGYDDCHEVTVTNTDPTQADTDDDGLNDKDEANHDTNPILADTDSDGVNDGRELELGFDPLAENTSFTIDYAPALEEGEDDSVQPVLMGNLTVTQMNTLSITRNTTFTEDSLNGYMGDAFDFTAETDANDTAPVALTVGFVYDDSALSPNAIPTIYAYDEDQYGNMTMTPMQTVVEDGMASALVDKFTTYVLVDRQVFEEDLEWIDTHTIDRRYEKLEIVFVMDDSGSMRSNDSGNQRLQVARNLIDQLPANTRLGIVSFEYRNYYSQLTGTSLITDKATAKNFLTTSYFDSNGSYTHMYDAIERSMSLFEATDADTMKMMVVLSDGIAEDASMHNSVISAAAANNICIYTIGLGSSSNYFTNYLQPLANSTGGEFHYSADAGLLADAFASIGEKISLTTDTDSDGLSDYYEENTMIFNGIQYNLDKNNPDTDGDGLLDGEEIRTTIIYNIDGTQMSVSGKILSDPSKRDSDNDGIFDRFDPQPMIPQAA